MPEPDSPTMPSTSPGRSEKLTPRTACTTPSSVGKRTLRSSTSSSGAGRGRALLLGGVGQGRHGAPLDRSGGHAGRGGAANVRVLWDDEPGRPARRRRWGRRLGSDGTASAVAVRRGVERVPDPVADQVDRQHDDQDGDAGEVEQPGPGLRRLGADRDQRSPARSASPGRRSRGSSAPPR